MYFVINFRFLYYATILFNKTNNISGETKIIIISLLEMSKNFIRHNIDNIKGKHKPPSNIQDEYKSRLSMQKNKKFQHIQSQYKQPSINNRVTQIQKKIQQQLNQRNRTQSMIIEQITQIKDDLKMIKSHLFESGGGSKPPVYNNHHRFGSSNKNKNNNVLFKDHNLSQQRQNTHSSNGGEQESIYLTVGNNGNNNRMKSQGSQSSFKQLNNSKDSKIQYLRNHQENLVGSSYNSNGMEKYSNGAVTIQDLIKQHQKKKMGNKGGLSIKSIYPILKQYKLEGPQFGTLFYGYSKRNSQAVAIKYIPSTQQINQIIQVYDKMWKNIAKSKWPCINRIYDYKIDDNNFIIMQKNKLSIIGLPYKLIVLDIFKSLQFVHECGYLYRNIEPEHFMLNQQGQLVIVDFKRAKRYQDIKGHLLDVSNNQFNGSAFASNNQVRGYHEGRKDDLESLGYFALMLMEYELPWYGLNKEQTIKVRSTMTLQELFKGHHGWIEYMATVMKTGKNDRPDYRRLQEILQNI